MKLLLDENIEARLGPYLVSLGHDVRTVARDYAASLSDQEVLGLASTGGRVLVTSDVGDFGDLIFRQRQPHAGVILLRLGNIAWQDKANLLSPVLERHAADLEAGHFLVVEPDRTRVREAPTPSQAQGGDEEPAPG